MTDCLFCKIIAGELPSTKVYEDEKTYAFLDINPVSPGHTLIVPKAHGEHVLESSLEDIGHIMATVQKIAPAIMSAVEANAFNLVNNCGRAAGQTVFHTHFHIIPRFSNDGLEHWPALEDHQDFEAMADKIKEKL